jgi:hypothetical protein
MTTQNITEELNKHGKPQRKESNINSGNNKSL